MLRTLIHALLCCGLTLLCQTLTETAVRAQETTRIAPASGGVEFEEIRIVRWAALGAVKEADVTNMQLGLWFAADWNPTDYRSPALIHLQSLSAVEDDTGRLLSTEKRLQHLQYLRGEVRGGTWKSSGGKQGPVVSFLLDAPARGANRLKAIKGKARVTLTKTVNLRFQDLAAVNGKILDHPDLKSLAAMKLRFSVVEKDGLVCAKLSAPVNYASPWNRGRLLDWDVLDGEKEIGLSSEQTLPEGEAVTVGKTYRHRMFKDLSLRLIVLDTVESKTLNFDFQNVELP